MKFNLLNVDSSTDRIYKFSGFSSTVLDSFSSPTTEPRGLAWDGTNLIYTDISTDRIYKFSGFSSTVLDSFSSPSLLPRGIVWDEINLLHVDSNTDKIYKFSGFSNTVLDSFNAVSTDPSGMAWDGLNLINVDFSSDRIYKFSGFSSTVLDSFSSIGATPLGLAWNGLNLINVDSSTDRIYKFSGFSSTVLDSFSSIGPDPSGLTYEVTLSSSSCIPLNNGNILIAYNSGQGGTNYKAMSRVFVASTQTWNAEVTVDSGNTGYTHPAVVQLASSASIPNRIIYAHRDKAAGTINIYKSDDNGASYSSLTTISINLDENNRISLARSGNTLVLSYHRGRTCYSRVSSDNGVTWGSENTISSNAIYPDLAVLDSGSFVCAYETYNIASNIYGKVLISSSVNGTSWAQDGSTPMTTTSTTAYTRPTIVVSDIGQPIIIAQEKRTKDLNIVVASNTAGSSWGSIQSVNPLPSVNNTTTAPFNFGLYSPSACIHESRIYTIAEAWDGTDGHIVSLKSENWRNITESTGYSDVYNPILGLPDKVNGWTVENASGSIAETGGVITLTTTSSVDTRNYVKTFTSQPRTVNGFKARVELEVDSGGSTVARKAAVRFLTNGGTLASDVELRFSNSAVQAYDNNAGANIGSKVSHIFSDKHEFLYAVKDSAVSCWYRSTHDNEIKWNTLLSNQNVSIVKSSLINPIVSASNSPNKVYRHSAFTNIIIDSFATPGPEIRDVTWDGQNIYFVGSGVTDKLFKMSGFSGTVSNSFAIGKQQPYGVAYNNGNFLISDDNTDRIYVFSGFSSSIIDSFSSPSTIPQGLDIGGSNLYHVDTFSDKIYKLSGVSNTVLDSFTHAGLEALTGVTFDGTNTIVADSTFNKIYKFSGFSNTIIDSFSSPSTSPIGVMNLYNPSKIEFGIYTDIATMKIHSIANAENDDGLGNGFTNPGDLVYKTTPTTSKAQHLKDGVNITWSGSNGVVGDFWTLKSAYTFPKEDLVSDSPSNYVRTEADQSEITYVFDAGENKKFIVDQMNLIGTNYKTGKFQMNDTDVWTSPSVDQSFTMPNETTGTITSLTENTLTDSSLTLRLGQLSRPNRPMYVRITSGAANGNTYAIENNTATTIKLSTATLQTDGVIVTDTFNVYTDRVTKQITEASHRFMRLVIDSQKTSDGYYKTGKFVAGKKIQLSYNFDSQYEVRTIPNIELTRNSRAGQTFSNKKGNSKKFYELTFTHKNSGFTNEIDNFFEAIDWADTPFVFFRDGSNLNEFIVGRLVSNLVQDHLLVDIFNVGSLVIEEEI